ncbi:ANL family adenylate-forming protein [Campylobacter sp. RM16192]|uniref:ANL family adenylate-forming protein n=1 Tax=Campylobacter sp. RM16192 TaxID=1660080 RepID=UPI00145187C5|nr:fatty acid--CoA ligase family protein [Campylobacter sp. RM16192]QCD51837.1 acyl-CoA synthetase (AMP-forming)/AMP-acid ligase II [Campylobacter sp. RM16192]
MVSFLLKNFSDFSKKNAVIHNNKIYTYEDLLAKINEFKSKLSDIKSGEVVGLIGGYSFENIALFLALFLNKNIIVPINSNIDSEVEQRLKEAFANKTITYKNGLIFIKDLCEKESNILIKKLQDNDNSGLILFSSGSLAKPKAIVHNLDNLVLNFKDKKPKNLKMLLFLLFDHIGGLNTLLNGLAMGATLIIANDFSTAKICELIEKFDINVLPTTPSFLNLLLINKDYEKFDLNSLKLITYGTERMDDNILKRLKEVFSKVKFIQTFGTSETGIMNTNSKSSTSTFFNLNPDEYKIVDGELYIKSKTAFLGYLNADNHDDNGWFKTGDLVEVGENGFLKIIGRSKEMINVGGNKLLAGEVESLILQIPDIKDVLVYAENNAILGQNVACDVVCNLQKDEVKNLIRSFLRDKIPSYKIPARINVVNKIDMTARFKKDRRLNR